MDPGDLFGIANLSVLPAWLLLLVAPRWKHTSFLTGILFPAILSIAYVVVLGLHWGEAKGGFGTLYDVKALFANDWVLLAGWIHYLAFDMFVGSWEVRDARRHHVSRWILTPCLLLTFFFGPGGFVCYLIFRYMIGSRSAEA
ncbi:hypothetical protein F183_A46110 [Bryobacterales bacterium F-183]|nr:hypothetical protein F183_A46110 [Bryobacterales bacterium F-183]